MNSCHFQLASGLTLAGWYSGPEQGPLLLASHGWLDNADSFLPLAQAMPEQRILSIDWPGHGHSSHLGVGGHYHFMDWPDVLYQLIQQLQEPVILMGHSMGALVATVFAGTFPELVKGVILLEGFGPLTAKPEQAPDLVRQSIENRKQLREQAGRKPFSLERAVAARRLADAKLPEDIARILCMRNLQGDDESGYQWRYDPKLKALSPYRMTEAQAQSFMTAIQAPCLAIEAEEGHEQVKKAITARRSQVEKITLKCLSGGHHVHMSSPERLASEIAKWLKSFY